ncbi:hypothetical protein FFWV33_11750 [Flavobacterium faecale]|uniref:Carbohydrate-binding domain-containing protein n=1 Tax=Flavobacterium faecale TaxID=1355330 RepID=A0A2S1LF21_9FLAO|nr:carbohydrate-binding family 9-like protein [Flavobacterium faecale]AWG22136.1 hypothetical protein FFWV33_11750 [Flavobacterium faecale]
MNKIAICILASLALVTFSCDKKKDAETTPDSEKKLVLGEQPIFKVSNTSEAITIDGKMDEEIWSKTESRTFDYIYKVEKPTDKQKTTFRMLWDKENLYLFYDFEDKYLTARETKRDGKPFLDDCGEIFIIPVPDSLNTHFGIELNINKAANDFIYFNNYYQEKQLALKTFNPDYETAVNYNGTVNNNTDIDKGWQLEIKIPLATFGFLGEIVPVQKGNKWAFLAIRQDRNEVEGERRITSTLFPIYDISKDVHQPNRFGLMEFVY